MTYALGQARECSAVDVVEDFADEIGVGDVFDEAELPTAERAEGDVDVEDTF